MENRPPLKIALLAGRRMELWWPNVDAARRALSRSATFERCPTALNHSFRRYGVAHWLAAWGRGGRDPRPVRGLSLPPRTTRPRSVPVRGRQ